MKDIPRPPSNRQPVPNVDAEAPLTEYLYFLANIATYLILAQFAGYIPSIVILWALRRAREWFLRNVLGLEMLQSMDCFFLYDDYKNRANIVAVGIYEKFDKEKVIAQFKEKAFRFPRLKQRLVRFAGDYCWKSIGEVEFAKMVNSMIVDLKDREIHNEEQLADFVSHET